MNKRDIFIVSGVAVSFVSGAGLGYFLAKKKLDKQFDDLLREELDKTAAFYQQVNKTGDFSTPAAAAEKLVGEAAVAMVDYGTKLIPGDSATIKQDGVEVPVSVLDEVEVKHGDRAPVAPPEDEDDEPAKAYNVWDEAPEAYPITEEDFMTNDSAYDQVSCTYYEMDSVVAEHDKPLADVDRCVGIGNLATYGDDDYIYVRNDRLKIDYEISKSTGSFAVEVLGLGEDGLRHSDEPFSRMPRRRHLRDD